MKLRLQLRDRNLLPLPGVTAGQGSQEPFRIPGRPQQMRRFQQRGQFVRRQDGHAVLAAPGDHDGLPRGQGAVPEFRKVIPGFGISRAAHGAK